MGTAAKKPEPSEIELALARVAPFVCVDPARMQMNSPFHVGLWGRPYVAATDGHSAAIVHCPTASSSTVTRPVNAERPPPLHVVIPNGAERIGEIMVDELEGLRELPGSWTHNYLHFIPGMAPRLHASRIKGPKLKQRTIKIFDGAHLPFKNTIEVETAIYVPYLLRALDFAGVSLVTVWREGRGKKDLYAPLLFTRGVEHYKEAARVAIVMPCRP